MWDSKIRHGSAICGKIPFGYRIGEDKHLEIVPENAAIILDAFEHYRSTVSVRATATYIRQTYGQNWDNVRCRRNLCQTLYIGRYESNGRVNENFCPPIVPRELFDAVQKLLSNNAKANPTGRVFLFTSLLICAECGHRLAGIRNGRYCYYRCRTYTERRTCPHKKQIREEDVEQWLFSFLGDQLEKQRLEWDIKEVIPYDISFTYYLQSGGCQSTAAVAAAVNAAVERYKTWQSAKLGRDINPDELREYLYHTGIKRIALVSPAFTVLREDWDYTLAGLSQINRESIDAIRTAVWELEKAGYIKRRQGRDEKGKMTAIEYTIYEQPQPPEDTPPGLDKPILENPTPGSPILENPTLNCTQDYGQ